MKKFIFVVLLLSVFIIFVIIQSNRISTHTAININSTNSDTNINTGVEAYNYEKTVDNRSYLVHVPQNHDNTKPTPLVLAFHGGSGNKEMMATDDIYGWISESNENGFIVVFPNGASRFRSEKLATWNAGECCAFARDSGSDDVGFVKEIISEVSSRHNIDMNRVFATGMSNGGMFSHRLACEISQQFSAIASVAGTNNFTECNPQVPVSVFTIHALDDANVQYYGGYGGGNAEGFSSPEEAVTDYVSVPDTVAWWAETNNCTGDPQMVLEVEGAYCEEYTQCVGGKTVKLCTTENGAHSWPGGIVKPRESAATPSQAIDATGMIWDFFAKN